MKFTNYHHELHFLHHTGQSFKLLKTDHRKKIKKQKGVWWDSEVLYYSVSQFYSVRVCLPICMHPPDSTCIRKKTTLQNWAGQKMDVSKLRIMLTLTHFCTSAQFSRVGFFLIWWLIGMTLTNGWTYLCYWIDIASYLPWVHSCVPPSGVCCIRTLWTAWWRLFTTRASGHCTRASSPAGCAWGPGHSPSGWHTSRSGTSVAPRLSRWAGKRGTWRLSR